MMYIMLYRDLKHMFRICLVTIIFQCFCVTNVFADNCFVAKENGKLVKELGKCNQRHSLCSTFKIPLALMGFDFGVLDSVTSPKVEYDMNIETKYVTYSSGIIF